jgi:hypothetical protein
MTTTTLPASIVRRGIEGRCQFLRIVLPSGPVEFSWHDWRRLPAGLLERVKAAADYVEMTTVEVAAVEEAREATDRAIAGNTGVARSTRARKG